MLNRMDELTRCFGAVGCCKSRRNNNNSLVGHNPSPLLNIIFNNIRES